MNRLNAHDTHKKRSIFWLCLTLFVLVVAACGGTILLFHSLHTPATRHYLLTGHTVFAFEGGHKLWQRSLPSKYSSLPKALLVKEDRLYVAAGPILALDKETGKILWERQIPLVAALFTQEQIATSLFYASMWKRTRNGCCALTHRREPSSGNMQKQKPPYRLPLLAQEGT